MKKFTNEKTFLTRSPELQIKKRFLDAIPSCVCLVNNQAGSYW